MSTSGGPSVESLTGKLGPLPVWGWAVLVSAPIIGYKIVQAHRASAAAATLAASAPTNADTDAGTIPGETNLVPTANSGRVPTAGLYYAGNPGGVYTGDDPATSTTPASTLPTTNAQWINYASDMLVSKLDYQPAIVLDALRAVLDGTPVTSAQEAIFNTAVRAAGNPPGGIPQIQRAPTQAPTPTGPDPSQAAAAAAAAQAAAAAAAAQQAAAAIEAQRQAAAQQAAAQQAAAQQAAAQQAAAAAAEAQRQEADRQAAAAAAAAGARDPNKRYRDDGTEEVSAQVQGGETLFSMLGRLGLGRSVADVQWVAAHNGKSVGRAPNYAVNLTPGETIWFG